MERVILLIGGNIGDVEQRIERAVEMIGERIGEVTSLSTMMVSEAWGFERETPQFTNQAVELLCDIEPREVLALTQDIERELGRERERESEERRESGARYLSREIDIDIIFYGARVYCDEQLRIPHALMSEREFVLRPIVEIAPEWRDPRSGKSCRELLEELEKRD